MKILGLMSGTSLDGIDAALLEVREADAEVRGDGLPGRAQGGAWAVRWELLAFRTRVYRPPERQAVQEALSQGSPRDLALLHTRLGEWFAQAALELLEEEGLAPEALEAIGSHGQTIWHEPPGEGGRGSSLQLGCPATLAERTGVGVVSDFRSRDLAAGGHGAPLVPWADRVFFSSPAGPRALQNLGGMANVTWLPRATDPEPLLAFDTGPGVAPLNIAAEQATAGALAFDVDGELARRGEVCEPVLARLLSHPFFQEEPPRSTGREAFGSGFVEEAAREFQSATGMELVPGSSRGWPDFLATLTALTVRSTAEAYRRWVLPRGVDEVFLMGGGARNPVLVAGLQEELHPLPVRSGDGLGMNPDAREAAAFALLAWAHLQGIPANVPEATGSEGPRVLGSWTPGGGRVAP